LAAALLSYSFGTHIAIYTTAFRPQIKQEPAMNGGKQSDHGKKEDKKNQQEKDKVKLKEKRDQDQKDKRGS
jgi:hypothetical protein